MRHWKCAWIICAWRCDTNSSLLVPAFTPPPLSPHPLLAPFSTKMELDVPHTPAATVGINSCVCVGDRVWVNMGTKEGVRGQNSSDQYWAKVVVGLNPNTEKVGVHREGIGYRVRQVPVLACSVDPASGDTSASSVGPDPNSRPSWNWKRLGRKEKNDLKEWRRRKSQTTSGDLCWSAIN